MGTNSKVSECHKAAQGSPTPVHGHCQEQNHTFTVQHGEQQTLLCPPDRENPSSQQARAAADPDPCPAPVCCCTWTCCGHKASPKLSVLNRVMIKLTIKIPTCRQLKRQSGASSLLSPRHVQTIECTSPGPRAQRCWQTLQVRPVRSEGSTELTPRSRSLPDFPSQHTSSRASLM